MKIIPKVFLFYLIKDKDVENRYEVSKESGIETKRKLYIGLVRNSPKRIKIGIFVWLFKITYI